MLLLFWRGQSLSLATWINSSSRLNESWVVVRSQLKMSNKKNWAKCDLSSWFLFFSPWWHLLIDLFIPKFTLWILDWDYTVCVCVCPTSCDSQTCTHTHTEGLNSELPYMAAFPPRWSLCAAVDSVWLPCVCYRLLQVEHEGICSECEASGWNL